MLTPSLGIGLPGRLESSRKQHMSEWFASNARECVVGPDNVHRNASEIQDQARQDSCTVLTGCDTRSVAFTIKSERKKGISDLECRPVQ